MEVPIWISKVLKARVCPHCDIPLSDSGLKAISIREDKENKKNSYLNLNYTCIKCNGTSEIFVKQFKMQDLVSNMVDEYNKDKKKDKSNSKISTKEVSEFLKKMNETVNHDDFLKIIGITEQDLKRYNDV